MTTIENWTVPALMLYAETEAEKALSHVTAAADTTAADAGDAICHLVSSIAALGLVVTRLLDEKEKKT